MFNWKCTISFEFERLKLRDLKEKDEKKLTNKHASKGKACRFNKKKLNTTIFLSAKKKNSLKCVSLYF
jgi:hypothetical protein